MKLSKVYEPGQYEADIYALWEKSGSFEPKHRGSKESFSLVIPPPNANANIHIGTGMTLALEDIVVRYQRMKGKSTLFVPGADHAGFETQAVFEKHLAKEGKSRFDFSREELYTQIWDFVAANRSNFETQFRCLGASLDWSRYTFTLDEKVVAQAYATFKKMWDEGLIYRGERLVNFCTLHGTAFADIEVIYKEVKGNLWHIRYPLTDGSGEVVVATTRPETMLGDTAVAVHPDDERYKQFLGKTVKLPLTEREIPILSDDMVDQKFGTGAVKITPAHDINDYDVAERHDLPMVTVINHEGKMTSEVPEAYRNLSVEEARAKVLADLESQGFLVKTEDHTHSVGHCYKCETIIQPLLREQWFIDMQPLAAGAIKALKANKITFHPEVKKDQLITYLKGLKDWNISRQIAWGIPIPAFQNVDEPDDWIYDDRASEPTIQIGDKTYRRDPDVFDTWFSSSSWPYATLNYPDGKDYKQFYPLSLMETGGEILYPWVSRMIMLGLYVTGKIPFKEVYIHGYVMAEDGSKMSKSIGNVVDPLPVIEEYGSDALRMGIIAGRAPAVNRGYDKRKVEAARNFCNKLWNVARYVEDKLGEGSKLDEKPNPQTSADHWMLNNLQRSIDKVSSDLDNYRFSEAYDSIYHLVWDDFADWYIEASKSQLNSSVLGFSLTTILKLAHPFAPFLTETIWQTLAWDNDSLLITTPWPAAPEADQKKAEVFEEIKQIVTEIRYIRSILNVHDLHLYFSNVPFLADNSELIAKLANIESVSEVRDGYGLHLTQTKYRCWLDIDQEVARSYSIQLQKKQVDEERSLERLKARLDNRAYVSGAPKNVIEQTRQQLADSEAQLAKITEEYNRFNGAANQQ